MPASVGRLAESLNDSGPSADRSTVAGQLSARVTPRLSHEERETLDEAFAAALHQTGTSFGRFDDPIWCAVFDMISPQWTLPSSDAISTHLLARNYQDAMMKMNHMLQKATAVTIYVDGATKVLSRNMLNLTVSTTRGHGSSSI